MSKHRDRKGQAPFSYPVAEKILDRRAGKWCLSPIFPNFPDSIDAVSAAILGNELFCAKASNVPHATGAQAPVVLGRITPA